MKVLKPSSIQALRRSSEPTIMGYQVWPNSWAVIQNSSAPLSSMPSNTSPGYSMPEAPPAMLTAVG